MSALDNAMDGHDAATMSAAARVSSSAMRVLKRHSISDSFTIVNNPLPEVPARGARLKVCFAGACIFEGQVDKDGQRRLRVPGIQDTSLFQGFEVSGVVDEVGGDVEGSGFQVNDRVIVYPTDQELIESGFAEYITVKDVDDLIKVPDDLAMQVAATLPAGGLRSYSAVLHAKPFIEDKIAKSDKMVVVMIVGAGAMGLLTLKLARLCIPASREPSRVFITVADTNLKKLQIAREAGCSEIIHWDEAIHEEYITMRTRDACQGGADIIIDFVSSPRSVTRSMNILNESGVILVGGNSHYEVSFDLSRLAHLNQSIVGVPRGTKQELQQLVQIFADGQIEASLSVYPLAEADRVFDMLSQCHVEGRAVLDVCGNHQEHDSTTSSMVITTISAPAVN